MSALPGAENPQQASDGQSEKKADNRDSSLMGLEDKWDHLSEALHTLEHNQSLVYGSYPATVKRVANFTWKRANTWT